MDRIESNARGYLISLAAIAEKIYPSLGKGYGKRKMGGRGNSSKGEKSPS